ncbi:hypothetical protein PPYR_13052 [Photinus pyralis]|uniref:Adenylosuccinate synthetase n=1 Tax=Photinus pyralis TaxID=7054 RepID=A0A5N4A7Z5_PHOPY|nr:adenylosuccinate synthetase-like [Photinus pyralis]XP_031353292.1 adenylosuccinate synthetase-like [Photinus pyralis]KAB0793432.1 hypothetical protein PPYR_13052 [Photinus pyralis]
MESLEYDANAKVTAVIGAQWGDEGKGKLIHLLSESADVVCRCQGGNNASLTVVGRNGDYSYHLLPSGVFHPNCLSIIGNGVVLHIPSLVEELESDIVKEAGSLKGRLLISDKAHIVFDLHQQVDRLQEVDGCFQRIGTTKKGIGPTYASKVRRNGMRMVDLIGDFAYFSDKFRGLVSLYERMFPELSVDIDAELEKYKRYAEILRPYITETVHCINKCIKEGKRIFVEGANAALLDIDFGTYPFVTSSNCSIGGVSTGLGIPPTKIEHVIGVIKAYTTRRADGPFPTEVNDDVLEYLQMKGNEFNPVTGKGLRCGWLDLFALKYSDMINCYSAFALSKLDVLDEFKEIKVGISYTSRGKELDSFPSNVSDFAAVTVQYRTLPGWQCCTKNVKVYEELPQNAKRFVETIQCEVGKPVRWISIGEGKESMIVVP